MFCVSRRLLLCLLPRQPPRLATSARKKRTWRAHQSMSCARHRQTPCVKHEYKTRHVDYHVAHLTYPASHMKIGDFRTKPNTQECVRVGILLGFPDPSFRRSLPTRLSEVLASTHLSIRFCPVVGLFRTHLCQRSSFLSGIPRIIPNYPLLRQLRHTAT